MAIPVMSQAAIKSNKVDVNRIVISYEMEDLKSATGRAALEREVRVAAEQVCEGADYSKTRAIRDLIGQKNCFHSAVANALSELSTGEMQVTAR
jgi:UrcA family protein